MKRYLKQILFWNPAITVAITIFLGGFDDLGHRLIYSFTVATVVSHFCLLVFWLVRIFILRFSGPDDWRLQSPGWGWSVSLVAMPPGLYLAFKTAQLIGPSLGLTHVRVADADDYRFGLFIGTMIAALFFLVRTRAAAKAAARRNELRAQQLANERLQAQLSALTAQMNPHLLFNALNSVAELVATNPALAEETILRLSSLYRGVLNSSRQLTHPLSTELEICEAYLAIEKVRFGDRLRVSVDVSNEVDRATSVPALCLQPLVENAVKHGLSPKASGGVVHLLVRRHGDELSLAVEDDGVGLTRAPGGSLNGVSSAHALSAGAGTGLRNCRERLDLHYGERGQFAVSEREGGGTSVQMRIPIK